MLYVNVFSCEHTYDDPTLQRIPMFYCNCNENTGNKADLILSYLTTITTTITTTTTATISKTVLPF